VIAAHFYESSDARLKRDIKSISKLLPLKEFTWKDSG
jgi:hypothetical protein